MDEYPFLKVVDNQVVVKCAYLEVIIPEKYIEHNIARIIGQEIETFGMFDFFTWNDLDASDKPDKYHYRFPSVVRMCPSEIEIRRIHDEELILEGITKEYVLKFQENDLFIKSTSIACDSDVSRDIVDIIFKGFFPDDVAYDKIHNLWSECNTLNKVNLNVSEVILELILSELCRDPKDLRRPFRKLLNENPKVNLSSRKMVKIDMLPRYNSTFAAISSADPKQGITSSILRKRKGKKDKYTPIEDAIL